jgi:hypothetical protein
MSMASDHSSGRAEYSRFSPAGLPPNDNGSLPPPSSFGRDRSRVTASYVADLATQLSTRDQAIVRDLARVRVLTGNQLERLHFHELAAANRDRARRRVLSRLIAWRVVTTLARRVGGVRAGSNGLVYSLDTAGQRVLPLLDGRDELPVRRPWTPGVLFLAHTLAVTELYVRLREAERVGRLELSTFHAEPASWQRTTTLGTVKPDAYALLAHDDIEDAWWIEVDQATESPATLRRKLSLYVLAAQAGVVGPDEIMPRVLITVPDTRRLEIVQEIVGDLGPAEERLISVTLHNLATEYLAEILHA